jgi:chorismate mutase/prephenate dehydratase
MIESGPVGLERIHELDRCTWSKYKVDGSDRQSTMVKVEKTNRPEATSAPAEAPSVDAELARLRVAIDSVDGELLALLNQRAEFVREVGRVKEGGRRSPVYVASRERDLVDALVSRNPGPFPDAAIPHVFREIISATRSLEERVSVAYLGPEGTFSHQAVIAQFGSQVDLMPVRHMSDIFTATERGETHYGVIPVENTIEGAINLTYDGLMESEVTICGEVMVEVSQNLLSQSGRLEDVSVVASHPQPLAQCRGWLHSNLSGAEMRETPSTASAAQLAAEDAGIAAIGSEIAAESYGLKFLARGIEDHRGNTTRFLVLGKETPAPSGNDLTSAAFTVRRDQAGALFHLLEPFAQHGVNLTAVQSRPMKGKPWEYIFFIDMQGHETDETVGKALDAAAKYAHSYKILGSFPRAAQVGSHQLGRRSA